VAEKGTEERNLPASAKKLLDARKKGQVPKSKDMTGAVALALGALYLAFRGPGFMARFMALIREAGASSDPASVARRCVIIGFDLVAPMFAVIVIGVIATAIVALRGLPVSFDPVVPKFEKINPVEGFKRLFSLRSVVELTKTMLKIVALGTAILLVARHAGAVLGNIPSAGLRAIPPVFAAMMIPILAATAFLFLATGLADVGLQSWLFRRDQRMGHTERKREMKDTEGDPLFRRHRRQVAREASFASGRLGIAHATFLVFDGASVLVALRYERSETPVPLVVARARGSAIEPMLTTAAERNLQVVENAEVARIIADTTVPGSFIPESTYRPVAVMLARMGRV
jgi:type III secretion protein U